MPTPTILVPKEKSRKKKQNVKGHLESTDTDIEVKNGHEAPTDDYMIDQKAEKSSPNENQDFVIYQFFGQNIPPKKETWVQFMGTSYGQTPNHDGSGFHYEPSRNSFVKLVLTIVLFMLILTAGFNLFVHMTPSVTNLFRSSKSGWILIASCVGMLAVDCVVSCCQCGRVPPCSYICIALAVVFMSLITSYFTVKIKTILVFYALIATVITVMVCVFIACSSFDFTKYLLYIIAAAAVVATLSLLFMLHRLITKTYIKPLHLGILIVGTLLNVVILIAELQMILGGKTVELAEDDYALGAFMLYTSIVNLFLHLLKILHIVN